MKQALSAVTLGVSDLARARHFYEALGWTVHTEVSETVFFQANGFALVLWDRAKLAADSGVEDAGGWGGVTLAHNVGSPGEVDDLLAAAERAGGAVTLKGAATDWGGYHGAFTDPEGHAWEVAHNPFWTLYDDGSTSLDEPQ
ncbi:VOC family protein [Thermoleophilia bacterium SCSIO 60948]|nr:VOC family protein [Thermoleophilia bacterium SCSIO 60948]